MLTPNTCTSSLLELSPTARASPFFSSDAPTLESEVTAQLIGANSRSNAALVRAADVARGYDIVLLDPPSALRTISLAVLPASNALLVPLAATTHDFCSTVQFLSMMDQMTRQLRAAGISVDHDFRRLICSKFDGNGSNHAMMQQIMEQTFGAALLPVLILESAEISHASLRMMTVYELDRQIGTAHMQKRCRSNLNKAMGQVEQLIRRGWGRPALLREMGDAEA